MDDSEVKSLALLIIPCSCGKTFPVAKDDDSRGTNLPSFLICSNCGKRHDPKNRFLRVGYEREGTGR
jgi:hypothetical protein